MQLYYDLHQQCVKNSLGNICLGLSYIGTQISHIHVQKHLCAWKIKSQGWSESAEFLRVTQNIRIYRSPLTNIARTQTRGYLNKSDPAVLMEGIINKLCEVLTWCVPVAAGASTYKGLVYILDDVFQVCSHICRITSSDLPGNELCL